MQSQFNMLTTSVKHLDEYNDLLDRLTTMNEMAAVVYIYDYMLANNIEPNTLTYKYIDRLHSKTVLERNTIIYPDDGKRRLQPRRRIHKIMKGYNYSDKYTSAKQYLDAAKKLLETNPAYLSNYKITNDKIKLAKIMVSHLNINMATAKLLVTSLKRGKFI